MPPEAQDSGAPLFAEPWEATVQAIAQLVVEGGHVTPQEWAEALGAAIRRAQAEGDPDDGTTYYRHVLAALEALLLDKGLVAPGRLAARLDGWRRAYETTPHGEPVVLPPD